MLLRAALTFWQVRLKMTSSPTAKEVSVDLSGFKSSVDQQFKSLKDEVDKRLDLILKLIFAMFGIFPIIAGGGFLLRNDLGEVKVELGKIGVQISALHEDLSRIEKRIDKPVQISDAQILALQTQLNSVLRRIEDKLNVSASGPLALTDDDKNLIRSILRRDQAAHRGHRHLHQRDRHQASRRRHPARTKRRMGGPEHVT